MPLLPVHISKHMKGPNNEEHCWDMSHVTTQTVNAIKRASCITNAEIS